MAKKKASAPAVDVRSAQPGDEYAIAELIAGLAEYELAPEANKSTPESVRQQLFGDKPGAEVLMASIDGKVAGFALFFPSFSTWLCKPGLYLEDLFVKPDFRKNGVAKALLQRLAAICIEREYGRLEWACLEWNELAKGFYRHIGSKPLDEWRTWRMEGDSIGALASGAAFAKEAEQKKPEPPKPAPPEPNSEPEPAPVAEKKPAKPASEIVEIYTDGGCQPNPGVGAWAVVMNYGDKRKEIVGGEKQTTNNRMELMAAISALETLKRPCKVKLHTDSQYVKQGITKWIHNWKRKKWRKADGEPVMNSDLWERLDKAIGVHTVEWAWVRGHAGEELNERCDVLCGQEIARLRKEK